MTTCSRSTRGSGIYAVMKLEGQEMCHGRRPSRKHVGRCFNGVICVHSLSEKGRDTTRAKIGKRMRDVKGQFLIFLQVLFVYGTN
jgi:hypothetical protein